MSIREKTNKIFLPFIAVAIALTIVAAAYIWPDAWPLITGAFCFCVLFFLMHLLVGMGINRLTIPSFFWYSYSATIFFPSLYFFYQKPEPFRTTFILAVISALIMVVLGVLFASVVLNFKKSEISRYFSSPVQTPGKNYFQSCLWLFAVALGLTLLYMVQVKIIPLFYMISHPGESVLLTQLRELSLKVLDSPFRFAFYFLRDTLYPFMITIVLGSFLCFRNLKWFILAGLFFITGFVYASFTLARFPPAAIILIIFLFLYLFFGGRISKRLSIMLAFLFFLFPIIVLLFSQSGAKFTEILDTLQYRIMLDPSNTLYYYFEVVPDKIDFLGGATMGKLSVLFGKEYFNLANYISFCINPAIEIDSSSANAAFIGDLYANFGMAGVALGSFLTGLLMQIINIFIIRGKKTIFNLAANAYLFFTFGLLVIMPLPSQLIYSGLPILLIILFFEQLKLPKASLEQVK